MSPYQGTNPPATSTRPADPPPASPLQVPIPWTKAQLLAANQRWVDYCDRLEAERETLRKALERIAFDFPLGSRSVHGEVHRLRAWAREALDTIDPTKEEGA